MVRHLDDVPEPVLAVLRSGCVIPAHPLALYSDRKLDSLHQRAITRYYCDAGVGGIAVGVHATQFAIRDFNLYEPVLALAALTVREWAKRPVALVAGLAGPTDQARREAERARGLGYHVGLLSLGAMKGGSEDELIAHCRAVADVFPLFGFYLQPAAGGIVLSERFWRRFAAIENVVAIKIAPFNRYRTLDVVRGVVAARAEKRITLYTGNDDHIVDDLLTPFRVMREGEEVTVRMLGGLLGHWSVWTQSAVQLLERIRGAVNEGSVDLDLLAQDAAVTDMNGALFDAAHDFRGCIPGCHEVLRRAGLMKGIWCLDPSETLSPGQAAELDRVVAAYPHLTDPAFVKANLGRWLG